MSGTDIRVIDLPDLGAVSDTASIVADKAGTGRFSALAVKNYCATTTLPDAPSNNTPYGRMNGAWTPVLPEAPAGGVVFGRASAAWAPVVPEAPLTGSAYGRMNGSWTSVLPTSGGSISGNLGVNGNISSGSGIYCNTLSMASVDAYEWGFSVQSGSGNHLMQHRAGWYDLWESATGIRYWGSPTGIVMQLDGAGSLFASGYVHSPQFWVFGTANSFGLSLGGSGRILQFMPNYYLDFAVSGPTAGVLQYVDTVGPLWVMRPSDAFCFNPQSSVGGNGAYLNISDRRAKANIVPTTRGLTEVLQLQPMAFDRANPATPPGAPQEIGFIAQDVQPIVPEAVWGAAIPLRDGSGGLGSADPTLAISESTITALNVNAIKELHALVTTLTNRLAALEGRSR